MYNKEKMFTIKYNAYLLFNKKSSFTIYNLFKMKVRMQTSAKYRLNAKP